MKNDKNFITQTELAKIVGVTKGAINQLAKKGLFDKCFTGKLLNKDCALTQYYTYKSKNSKIKKIIKKETDTEVKKSPVFKKDNITELAVILNDIDDPLQRMQVTKEYWQSKLNEQKYLENEGELISVESVQKQAFEAGKRTKEAITVIPERVSAILASIDDPNEIKNILRKEIDIVLGNIAESLRNETGDDI